MRFSLGLVACLFYLEYRISQLSKKFPPLEEEPVYIDLLANHPQHLPTAAQWLFEEWGDSKNELWIANATKKIGAKMSTDSLPAHLIAIQDDKPLGFIALKFHEMEEYPEREHWLGSLYVIPEARGRNIGSALIKEVIKYAELHNVPTISLQTTHLNGGLYAQHGWQPVEQITSHGEEVLVMERKRD